MTTNVYSTSPRDIFASANGTKISLQINEDSQESQLLVNGKIPMGVDLAVKYFQVCYQSTDGKFINVKLELFEFRELLRNNQGKFYIGIEACSSSSYWCRYAEKLGHEVKIMPAVATRLSSAFGNKDDYNDAYAIYTALFNPAVPSIKCRTEDELALSSIVSEKELLTKGLNTQVNKVRSFIIELGAYYFPITDPSSALRAIDYTLVGFKRNVQEKHTYAEQMLTHLRNVIVFISNEIDTINQTLSDYAMHNQNAKLLMSIPGVGPELAAAIANEVDINRFNSASNLQAYFGMNPSHTGSGGKIVMGRISNTGFRPVKRCLYQAALSISKCHKGEIYRSKWIAETINSDMPFKKKVIRIASKLIRLCFGVLKHQTPYNPKINPSIGEKKQRIHTRSNPCIKHTTNAQLQEKYNKGCLQYSL